MERDSPDKHKDNNARVLFDLFNSPSPLDTLAQISNSIPRGIKTLPPEVIDQLSFQLQDEATKDEANVHFTYALLPQLNTVVQKYRGLGVTDDDLLSHGTLFLIESAQTWLSKNQQRKQLIPFRQYVFVSIKRKTEIQICRKYGIEHTKFHIIQSYFDTTHAFHEEWGRLSDYEDLPELISLARLLNPTVFGATSKDQEENNAIEKNIRTFIQVHQLHTKESLTNNIPMTLDSRPTEIQAEQSILKDIINDQVLPDLTPFQKQIIVQVFLLDNTRKTVAQLNHLPLEEVFAITNRALTTLRSPSIRRLLRDFLNES